MTLNCPTCEIVLSRRSIGSETVQHCTSCSGTWFDPSELSSLLRTENTLDSFDQLSVDPPSAITCPKCKINISATIYAHDSGIPILKCSGCSGVWLAAGQLDKLFEYRNGPHKTDGLGQAMAESYARSNALNGFAELIQSRIFSILFAIAILVVATYSGAGVPGILRLFAFLLLPMTCIWFSKSMGNLIGIRMGLARPAITQSTPGFAVALAGWILMFAVFSVLFSRMVGR